MGIPFFEQLHASSVSAIPSRNFLGAIPRRRKRVGSIDYRIKKREGRRYRASKGKGELDDKAIRGNRDVKSRRAGR